MAKFVETLLTFDASKSVDDAIQSGNVGKACYKARIFHGDKEINTITIPPGENAFAIKADIGTTVAILLSAFDRDGNQSRAIAFQFMVSDIMPPDNPKRLAIFRTSVIDQEDTAASETFEMKSEDASVRGDDVPRDYHVNVCGHKKLIDGAIGQLTDITQVENNKIAITASFNELSTKSGKPETIEFLPGDPEVDLKILVDGCAMTMEEFAYAESVLKMPA
jgi:hypothetical protein